VAAKNAYNECECGVCGVGKVAEAANQTLIGRDVGHDIFVHSTGSQVMAIEVRRGCWVVVQHVMLAQDLGDSFGVGKGE
jgi:hypothetical protein